MAMTLTPEPHISGGAGSRNGGGGTEHIGGTAAAVAEGEQGEGAPGAFAASRQDAAQRRVIRYRYLAVKNLISDKKDDITSGDSDRFKSIITEVETLHELVEKPREQVADAEALLDIASTLMTSVRSQTNEGVTPSDFVSALLNKFGQNGGLMDNSESMFRWADVGHTTSRVFKNAPGCCTMIGPMGNELRPRKVATYRKKMRPTESIQPEEIADAGAEMKTDTDKNMSFMFDILRRKRSARMESLVLNRESFAQTVENIFALSFLVKSGRAEITVNDNGHHLVCPRNAPAASSIASGEVAYSHFVFRFDFKDWKLMINTVAIGEELMPHRTAASTLDTSGHGIPATGAATTPIRKFTRNRGLVVQGEIIVGDSLEDDTAAKTRKSKQLF